MNDEEEIIFAMRIAKEKIEELRTQLATNHERAEEIIRAREATIAELRERLDSETARANELDAVCIEIKHALDEMGAPIASAIGCRLLVSSERVKKLGRFVHPLSPSAQHRGQRTRALGPRTQWGHAIGFSAAIWFDLRNLTSRI